MKKLKIKFEHWDYDCSDGCCSDWGCKIHINDEEVQHYDEDVTTNSYVGYDIEVALKSVLKHLGYEVEFEWQYDCDEDATF